MQPCSYIKWILLLEFEIFIYKSETYTAIGIIKWNCLWFCIGQFSEKPVDGLYFTESFCICSSLIRIFSAFKISNFLLAHIFLFLIWLINRFCYQQLNVHKQMKGPVGHVLTLFNFFLVLGCSASCYNWLFCSFGSRDKVVSLLEKS